MNNGIVKWFNPAKGFGFITKDDGVDIFVHYKDLIMEGFKNLDEGDKVTFDIYEIDGRLIAKNVKKEG